MDTCTAPALTAFLAAFLGDWPDRDGLTVVGTDLRTRPGWDGRVHDVIGVSCPGGGVLSVAPDVAEGVRGAVRDWADVPAHLPAALGRPEARVFAGVFRWTTAPTELPDAGIWVPATDPRLPEWLRPFGGEALVAFDDEGRYAAGVGVKRHNPAGMEISVGTDEAHRGRGLASRLTAQAARWILSHGAVPIYLHDPANTASDRTALAAGFPNQGWQIHGLFQPPPTP
ncbi:GNAT family N-acetyltransferase [Catellatospora tritici]|uniref:GNAT family N-acetyltransferase n=1 Tax=Catellatospora tritici TaxID=2851566 RepID=UPI001C2D4232|nr:GNAT family N-acetyltransferase [Catellatospora tritici]MBV1852759.1 GNAT family N-acetyltransferase [Catellatospora tritici]